MTKVVELHELVKPKDENTNVEKNKESKQSIPLPGGYVIGNRTYAKGAAARLSQLGISRATDEPESLLKDLGIASVAGASKAQAAASALKQAVKSKVFGKYFSDVKYDDVNDVTTIKPSTEVQKYQPDRYIEAIMLAARNAGLCSFDYELMRYRLERDIVHIENGLVMVYDWRKTRGVKKRNDDKVESSQSSDKPQRNSE